MWDFCPETLLGLGSHSYLEWETVTVRMLGLKPYRWDMRRCSRCGKKDFRRVAHQGE